MRWGCYRKVGGGGPGYPRGAMAPPTPLAVMLAAPPEAPGARAVMARVAEAVGSGRRVRVILSAAGLAWAERPHLDALQALPDVAVCSRNAREAGWTAESTPEGLAWSSVATWLAELDADGRAALWTVLP